MKTTFEELLNKGVIYRWEGLTEKTEVYSVTSGYRLRYCQDSYWLIPERITKLDGLWRFDYPETLGEPAYPKHSTIEVAIFKQLEEL